MKIKLIYACLILFLLASCQKEYTPMLASPDKRIVDSLNRYKALITQDNDAWKLNFVTGNGQLYNFLFKFGTDNRVQMLSDISEHSAANYEESGYRLEALLRPSLIFDTYSYLHILSDPDPSVNNGTRGVGSKADFSFSLLSQKMDTIFLYGNYNKNKVSLVRLKQAEAQEIQDGAWLTSMRNFKTFYANSQYPYIVINNAQLIIGVDTAQKKLSFSTLENQVLGTTTDVSYAYDVNAINFSKAINFKNQKFDKLMWDDAASNYYLEVAGVKHYIQNYSQYPINIESLFGFGKKYAFLKIPSNKLDYGLNSDFSTLWQQSITSFKTSSKTIVSASFGFINATTFEVLIIYSSSDFFGEATGTGQFNAQALYTVTGGGTNFTLDDGTYSGNWTANEAHLLPFKNYFANASFNAKWVTSPDIRHNKTLMVGLHKNNSTTNFAYGPAK